ncbi:MAG: hypothetical protein K5908_09725 [Erysipelotrichaceae bacterium]|jgi:hypothetical protein|nr:hypothetical protein [Erysipelotrichaceae bacterium]
MENNRFEKVMIVLMLVISFWVPIAGILLYFLAGKRYPELRKKILIAAVIGFVVNYGLNVMKDHKMLWWGMN